MMLKKLLLDFQNISSVFIGLSLILGTFYGIVLIAFSQLIQNESFFQSLFFFAPVFVYGAINIFLNQRAVTLSSSNRDSTFLKIFQNLKEARRKFTNFEIIERLHTQVSISTESSSHFIIFLPFHFSALIVVSIFTLVTKSSLFFINSAFLLLVFLCMYCFRKWNEHLVKENIQFERELYSLESVIVESFETVQIGTRIEAFHRNRSNLIKKIAARQKKIASRDSFYATSQWGIRFFILILALGVHYLSKFRAEDVYLTYIFMASCTSFVSTVSHRLLNEASVEAVNELLKSKIFSSSIKRIRENYIVGNQLVVKNPSTDERLHQPLNFLFQPGDKILLKGNSGSGKTTLLRTLLGMHDSFEGELKVGSSLRFGYSSQNPQFFSGLSIRKNLFLEDSEWFTDFDLLLLEKLHLLTLFTRDENLLNKIFGQGSREFSKGELIRLALFREIRLQPDVLLLDEPLSGLGANDINGVENILKEHVRHTILFVAEHRPIHFSQNQVVTLSVDAFRKGDLNVRGSEIRA